MEGLACLDDVAWRSVVDRLVSSGWARLREVIDPASLEALEAAAPTRWTSLPDTEGEAGVRQAGISAHRALDESPDVVRLLADSIHHGIARVSSAPLPGFNHAQWCRAERGQKFITPHRDPNTAGGVIAVLTIRGRAVFRIWELEGPSAEASEHPETATTWDTQDGDLVLMVGRGWPLPTSRCPIHEAQSPLDGDRITLTLRHNTGGYGAAYFT